MFSYFFHLFWESNEDKLNKFRVILSMHRAELTKLQRISTSLTRCFYNYLKNTKNKDDIIEKANDLMYIYTKCEAYEKVAKAGQDIIERWDLFCQKDANHYIIQEALYNMHLYSKIIEQKEMIDWINNTPSSAEIQKIQKKEHKKISNENLRDFIQGFCKQFNLSYDFTNSKLVERN